MSISLLPRSRRRGRHQFDPDTAVTVADALREVPDEPQPDPLRDTGEIPGLSDAQAVFGPSAPQWAQATPELLARLRTALKGQHPFNAPARTETQRVREDAPRPRLQPLSPRTPRTARPPLAWEQSLVYPAAGGTSPADYRTVMRAIDRITGTRSPLTWAHEIESGVAA
jgi:hypothetical protein